MNILKDNINSLIIKISLPSTIGFFFQTMFNFTDTYFAGVFSSDALTALTLSFPIFMIVLALSLGLGGGLGALISNAIGAKEEHKALNYLIQAFLSSFLVYIIVVIPLFFSLELIFRNLDIEGSTLEEALRYTRIILIGSIFFILNNILNSSLTSRGDTKTYSHYIIFTAIVNVGLDPLLMFGIKGVIPSMGVAGLAIATIILQAIGTLYLGYKVYRKGYLKGLTLNDLRFNISILKELFKQGISSSFNMILISLGMLLIQSFLAPYKAIAGYGTAMRIEQVALMPSIGLNIALGAIVGQNNGAKQFDRIKESFKRTLFWGAMIFLTVIPVMFMGAFYFMEFFTKDPFIIEVGVLYLRTQSFTFYSYILLSQSTAVMQGLKKPNFIFIVALYRQIIAPFIIFSLLNPILGISGIFIGVLISNWSAALITFFYAQRLIKKRVLGLI